MGRRRRRHHGRPGYGFLSPLKRPAGLRGRGDALSSTSDSVARGGARNAALDEADPGQEPVDLRLVLREGLEIASARGCSLVP